MSNNDQPTALSPEGVLMLFIAAILDLIGLVLFVLSFFGIGIALSPILDIAGLVIIGGWMLSRLGTIAVPGKVAKTVAAKIGLPFVGELIPFFGDLVFCWTWAVWRSLK